MVIDTGPSHIQSRKNAPSQSHVQSNKLQVPKLVFRIVPASSWADLEERNGGEAVMYTSVVSSKETKIPETEREENTNQP